MYQIMRGYIVMLNRSHAVTKDRKSSLKLTKNVDVPGRHGAMINLYKQYGFNSG